MDNISLLKEVGINPIAIIIGLFLVWIINKLPTFLEYRKGKKQERIDSLDRAITIHSSESEKILLEELKNRRLFYDATGFDAHRNIREKAVQLILSSQSEYNIQQLIPIKTFLEFDQLRNSLVIEVSSFIWFGLSMMWSIYLISAIIFIILILGLIFILPIIPKLSSFTLFQLGIIFITPIGVLIAYNSEARKYCILNKLYKSHTSLFLHGKPKNLWLYSNVIIYAIDLYLIVYLGQNLALKIIK